MTRRDAAALLAAAALALPVLWPVLDGGFLTDDYHLIAKLTDRLELEEGFSWGNLGRLFRSYAEPPDVRYELYRPTVFLSFGVQVLASGADPRPFMAVNLILHLVSGALVFGILRRLLPEAPSLHLGAAVLVLWTSPLQAEPLAWLAARADPWALVFGAGAIFGRLGGGRVWPVVAAALALTCKESALVYVVVLILVDLRDAPRPKLVGFLRRAWPWAALVAGYLAVRYALFGTLLEPKYDSRALGAHAMSDLLPRYGRSLLRVAAPINRAVVTGGALHLALSAVSVAAFLAIAAGGAVTGWRRRRFALGVALLLMAFPFAAGVLVNEIRDNLIHGRAVHTSHAGWAILVALTLGGEGSWRRRWLPVLGALAVGLVLLRPGIALYARAYERMHATLESCREPLRALDDPTLSRVAVLGYRDARYFANAFDMSGSFGLAFRPPFLARRFEVTKVRGDFAADAPDAMTSFDELMARPAGDLVLLAMVEEEGELRARLAHAGPRPAPPGAALELLHPAPREVVAIDPDAASVGAGPRFRTRALAPASFSFGLVDGLALYGDFPLPPEVLERAPAAGGTEYAIRFPLADLMRESRRIAGRKKPLGWFVTARDAAGRVLARTPVRLYYVVVE